MCGIGGVVPRSPQPVETIRAMSALLAHRGPDDRDAVRYPKAGSPVRVAGDGTVSDPLLVHSRLSILDLTAAGHQPMTSPDGRHHIVYNGEIYNYIELRTVLESRGHRFESDTDTEVLLAAYREWGVDALHRLVGMFAFAILDREERTLFLARDFIGIKPLYYAHRPEGFVFASEIAALLAMPWVPRTAGLERIHHYLTTVPGAKTDGGETFFEHVRKLPPAHWVRLSLDDPVPPEPKPYWSLDLRRRAKVPYEEAVRTVREMFLRNVRLHLRSDVPVGAALSGGIDSSAIVMAMRALAGPEAEIHTFSYVAADPRISEERWVDVIGRASGATVHKVTPDIDAFLADLPRLIRHQGEPFGSTSIYAQYCVFRAARQAGIKVTLDGQGADEILAGYRHYYPARLASLVAAGHPIRAYRLFRAMTTMPGVKGKALLMDTVYRMVPRTILRPLARTRLAGRNLHPPWLDAKWFKRHGLVPRLEAKKTRRALQTDLARTATETGLPTLLRYADRNSMAFSVESRVPFLTPELVSYLLSLPEDYHIGPDGTTKRVFRDAMRGLVPDSILDRKDKIGFQTTEADWLRALEPYVRSVLASPAARSIPFIRLDEVEKEWAEVHSGRREDTSVVWRCLNLIQWTGEFGVQYGPGSTSGVPVPVPAEGPMGTASTPPGMPGQVDVAAPA